MTRISCNDKYEVCLTDEADGVNLFSDKVFIEHQISVQNKKALTFSLITTADKKVLITQTFAHDVTSSEWLAPITGAFGAMEASEYVTLDEIEFFVSSLTTYLCNSEGAESIQWRLPPLYYKNKVHTKLQNVLYRFGWKIKEFDLNFHLPVTNYELFRSNLSSSKRRELNRITKTNTEFGEAVTDEQRREVYDIIKLNRESQGYPMTMPWEAIAKLATAIGQKIRFYSLKREQDLLAGAICLVLDSDNLYVFYWGENPEFRKDSTIVKLAEGIYLNALEAGFSTLDIGTSTNHSEPNQGLINFKENIGCQVTQKLTLIFDKDEK
ncbi:GNAT family N-acetyltransferase [Pantoea allii]|uniref:GNAT family N-acetyltransferase n=1 Tax=Pantoea allii TaxID=574096 RepID=UPI0024B70C2E|nr:GNAT family N-acetyltransferase [Pantoea allii]MDJ0036565.1 GNAT family N-acetyltransferase [Pantoea allii]